MQLEFHHVVLVLPSVIYLGYLLWETYPLILSNGIGVATFSLSIPHFCLKNDHKRINASKLILIKE